MISTRHSSLIIGIICLVLVMVFGFGLISNSFAETAEPSVMEVEERWKVMNDNIRERMDDFLKNDPIMQDYGISIISFDWLQKNFEQIRFEEMSSYYADLYPGYDFESEWRAYQLSVKYTDTGAGTIRVADPLYGEIYQSDWELVLKKLKTAKNRGLTELYYEISPYFHLRFSDGEEVFEFLKRTGKINGDEKAEESLYALLDFLEKCKVSESGYLHYHDDNGSERLVLAWYTMALKGFEESDYEPTDAESLPGYNEMDHGENPDLED